MLKLAAIGLLIAAVLVSVGLAQRPSSNCRPGNAVGFVSMNPDPPYLIGTLPSTYTRRDKYFSRRFNCTGQSAFARRRDLGIYEVRFPGLSWRTAVVTAISQEGVTASVYVIGSTYRVALRGPIAGDGEVLTRRDVPFSVVIY